MTKWLNVSCNFPRRTIILSISRIDIINNVELQILKTFSDMDGKPDPYKLEDVIRKIIHLLRPDLLNCVIFYMEFNHSYQAWDIGVEHPSLPEVDPACMLKRVPLIIPEGSTYDMNTDSYVKTR